MTTIAEAAPPAHRPDALLIQFDVELHALGRARALQAVGGQRQELVAAGDSADLVRIELGAGASAEAAIQILSRTPGVKAVEHDAVVTASAVANDAGVTGGRTWGVYGDEGSPTNRYGSQATEAWASGHTGSMKVAVGVADTGVDYTHPDLYLNIWLNQKEIPAALKSSLRDVDGDRLVTFRDLNHPLNAKHVADRNANGRIDGGDLLRDVRWENGLDEDANGYRDDLIGWDFVNSDNDPMDDNGHGTHVAGIIGAAGGNGAGVAGVNWNVQLAPLKFMNAGAYGYTSNSIKALDYFTAASKNGAGVDFAATNNSWGGTGHSYAHLDAITRGAKAGILYVVSAGNNGSNNDATAYYPASYSTKAAAGYEAVISVASIGSTGALSSYSNYGSTSVDLGAPGQGIYSTSLGGGYGYKSGTSMAAPHVAGAVALYSAAHPGASAATIRAKLLESAAETASLDGKTAADGRLDIGALLGASGGGEPGADGGTAGVTVSGTSANDLISPAPGAGNDTLKGLAGADTLRGGAGADQLEGGAGADRLEGGTGADTMSGGEGSDVYYVDAAGDRVVETTGGSAGGGADKVYSNVSFVLGANLERLWLTGTSSIDGTGNAAENIVYGNAANNRLAGLAGDDYLSANGGADTLRGGAGADELRGGAGADRFVFARGEAAGDVIFDFGADDILQFTGYSAGSTISRVAGSATEWIIRDKLTGATEVLELANRYGLTSSDYLFG